MFCRKCGRSIPFDSVFCVYCGTATALPGQGQEHEDERAKENALPKDEKNMAFELLTELPAEKTATETTLPSKQQMPHRDAKKSRLSLVLGIGGSIIALFILISVGITAMALLSRPASFFTETAVTTGEERDEIGNTPANSMCYGIATMWDNTIFYMCEGMDLDYDMVKSIDVNENNEGFYFDFGGNISGLNIIGSQIFFIGDTYDENYEPVASGIYVYNLYDGNLKEIYSSESGIYYLIAAGNRLYFDVSDEDDTDRIYSADFDGTDVRSILEKPDYIYSLAVYDADLYYIYQNTLYRCDLDGQNTEDIYASANALDAYCLDGETLYVADFSAAKELILKKINLTDGREEDLAALGEDKMVTHLNVANNTVFYVEETVDEKGETVNGKICALYGNGSDRRTLVSSNESYYGLAICSHWLFSYDLEKAKTIKIDINNGAKNTV